MELEDRSNRPPHVELRGDFLRVKSIIENLETNEVYLCGYRLRRTKYMSPMFDSKCVCTRDGMSTKQFYVLKLTF